MPLSERYTDKYMFNFKNCQMAKLLFALLLSSSVNAARVVFITNRQAVVYADFRLTSPIGYLSRGKKVLVGNMGGRNSVVLPIIINDKIAWIKAEDVGSKEDLSLAIKSTGNFEHDVEEMIEVKEQEQTNNLKENNYASFRVGRVSSAELVASRNGGQGSDYQFHREKKSGSNFALLFEHKNPRHQWHWGGGLDYSQLDSSSVFYQILLLKGFLAWVPVRRSNFFVEFSGAVLLSDSFKLKMHGLGRYSGSVYGMEHGVLVRLFPKRKYGFLLGMNFFRVRIMDLSEVINTRGGNITALERFKSKQLFVGISYKF